MKYPGSDGVECPDFWNIHSFSEICDTIPPKRQFSYKKRNLFGVNLGERGLENHLLTAVAQAAA